MAFGEIFIIEDTGSETNKSHTSEADRSLSGTPTAQGDWSGQWSSPELTMPEANLYMLGYSDFLRQSGTARSGSIAQFALNGTKVGIQGSTSWGYNRYSGGADESARHGVYIDNLAASDVVKVREATQLNSSDRVGDYNRTSGDPRGMWALNLKGASDYLFASSSTRDNATGVIGNSPRPIDLGTPSSLTAGSWKSVSLATTDASSGTTITRSASDFTIAANSTVLVNFNFQFVASSPRKSALVRMDVDSNPYAYASVYIRGSGYNDGSVGSITIPVITGGSSVVVNFKFVDQAETTSEYHMDMTYKSVAFIDFTGQDICLLGKTDSDITNIIATPQQVSFPVADELQVDTSFDHPSANTSRITNNSGGELSVLAGFTVLCDRSSATNTARKTPMSVIRKNGTQLDYAIASEYSRGAQSSDDQFIAGYSYCAPVVMSASDYLELDIFDYANAAASNLIVNCTDDKAIYFWAISLESSGPQLYEESVSDSFTLSDSVDVYGGTISGTPGNPNLSSDNFNDNSFDTGIWGSVDLDSGGATGSFAEQNQRIEFSGTTGATANDYWEQRVYQDSVSGDYDVRIKIVSEGIDSGTGYDMENWLITGSVAYPAFDNYIGRTKTDSVDIIVWYIAGVGNSTSFTYSIPYYLRFKYESGTLYGYTSQNGTTWTLHASDTVSASSARYIAYDAWTETTDSTSVSSHCYIDDFQNNFVSGAVHEMVVDDSFTLSDTASGTVSTGNEYQDTVSGTFSLQDSAVAAHTMVNSVSDSFNLQDSSVPANTMPQSISDSFDLQDSSTPALTIPISLADSFTLNDILSGGLVITVSGIDSFTLDDSATGIKTIDMIAQDSFTLNDVGAAVVNFATSVSDTFDMDDSSSITISMTQSVEDSFNIDDSADGTAYLDVSVEDTIVFDDSVDGTVYYVISVADGFSVQDSSTNIQDIVESVEDGIVLDDSSANNITFNFQVEDSLQFQDVVSAGIVMAETLSDSFTITSTTTVDEWKAQIKFRAFNKTFTFNASYRTNNFAAGKEVYTYTALPRTYTFKAKNKTHTYKGDNK